MKFYLNNQEVSVLVAPKMVETQDETLDSLSVILEANSNEEPYSPMLPFKIVDGDETFEFVISSDTVEVFSSNPLGYRHTLNLVQNTKELSREQVRNSVFSQPYVTERKIKQGYSKATNPQGRLERLDDQKTEPTLTLNKREKVSSCYIKVSAQAFLYDYLTGENGRVALPKTMSEMSQLANTTLTLSPILVTCKKNGNTFTQAINVSKLNEKIEFPFMKEKILDGYDDFSFSFSNSGIISQSGNVTKINDEILGLVALQVELIEEVYYYSCYDVLNILLERQRKTFNGKGEDKLFNLPTSGDLYDLLNSTIAPNLTFTQMSFYDCVREIFNVFDATFTIKNGTLGIEFYNDYGSEVSLNLIGKAKTLTEDGRYKNYISNYQDAKVSEVYPKKGFMLQGSEKLGVPDESDHKVIVPHKIANVSKLEFKGTVSIPVYSDSSIGRAQFKMTLDVTDCLFEDSIYTLLPYNDTLDVTSFNLNNTFHYSKGSNSIVVNEKGKDSLGSTQYSFNNAIVTILCQMLGFTNLDSRSENLYPISGLNNNYASGWWRVSYVSTLDGRLEVESISNKGKGDTSLSQSGGSIDLEKLGLNLYGTSIRQGEPILSATHEITSFSQRVRKGQTITENGDKWVANVCSYTIYNDKIIGNIQFSKNYNSISNRVKIDRAKRLSQISSDLVQKSEDILKEYVYIGTSETEWDNQYLVFSQNSLVSLFGDFLNGEECKVDMALVSNYNSLNQIDIPLVKYGSGNALCFEMSFDSPISAGYSVSIKSGWFGSNSYYNTSVNYADDDGFMDACSISFRKGTDHDYSQDFPLINSTDLSYTTEIGKISNYGVRKQPNEVFALNYEMIVLSNSKDEFIGINFTKDFFKGADGLKVFKTKENYSVLDTKALGTEVGISYIDTSPISEGVNVKAKITLTSSLSDDHFAIADKNGNLYFSSNVPQSGNEIILYISVRRSRL